MQNPNILFIGLDTHKEFLEVAYIEDNRDALKLAKLLKPEDESVRDLSRARETAMNELEHLIKNRHYYQKRESWTPVI